MMVNIECQSSSFLFDNHHPPNMIFSANLYDDLSHSTAMNAFLETDEEDLRNATSPTNMTNSDSSDSAIVADDVEETDWSSGETSKYRNSWPKMMEKCHPLPPPSTHFASLSQSFDILNQLDRHPIAANRHSSFIQTEQKYKHPLPWLKSPPSTANKVSVECSSERPSWCGWWWWRTSMFSF